MHSWRGKVERAEHHLGDFCERIKPIQERRSYPAPKRLEAHEQDTLYIYRVKIPESDDPLLPIIAGDLMFNLRSALDHILVALVHEDKQTRQTAFPIFIEDIHDRDTTGKYLHPKARGAWRRKTSGVPEGAMAVLEWAQPYNLANQGLDPRYSSLAVLGAFQNADKHRQLVLVSNGLRDPVVRQIHSDGRRVLVEPEEPLGPDRLLRNGTIVSASPVAAQVKMETEGTLNVLIGDRRDRAYHACPEVFLAMIRNVAGILDRLEPFLS